MTENRTATELSLHAIVKVLESENQELISLLDPGIVWGFDCMRLLSERGTPSSSSGEHDGPDDESNATQPTALFRPTPEAVREKICRFIHDDLPTPITNLYKTERKTNPPIPPFFIHYSRLFLNLDLVHALHETQHKEMNKKLAKEGKPESTINTDSIVRYSFMERFHQELLHLSKKEGGLASRLFSLSNQSDPHSDCSMQEPLLRLFTICLLIGHISYESKLNPSYECNFKREQRINLFSLPNKLRSPIRDAFAGPLAEFEALLIKLFFFQLNWDTETIITHNWPLPNHERSVAESEEHEE
ncbi:MAG: hypothetical protein HQL50_09565 [Magnetococcales bacterium]|nr:hypothetical protein [Magnetococcales bacterium]